MTQVYAFEWCDCIYESGFSVVSLHATKAGAWRALRARLWSEAVEWRESGQRIGYDFTRRHGHAWRVRTIEVRP